MLIDLPSPSDGSEGKSLVRLLAHGFSRQELEMLKAIVHLSKKRSTVIELVEDENVAQADVVMIDAADPFSMSWAKNLPWLQEKAVVWVDAPASAGPCVINRPVLWHNIPKLVSDVLAQRAAAPRTAVRSPAPGRGASVLVVDDSVAVRSMLRAVLESQGLVVTDADNGYKALDLVASNSYDCVLLDVMMPGMDGYEACRKIKSNSYQGNPPAVVMLTSKSSPFDKIRGKMAGSDAYLTKPIKPEHLTEIVQEQIGGSSVAGDLVAQ